jgi:hypothetical protein
MTSPQSDSESPRQPADGPRRTPPDSWELVVREELRRLRRREPSRPGARLADVASRAAVGREDSEAPPPP